MSSVHHPVNGFPSSSVCEQLQSPDVGSNRSPTWNRSPWHVSATPPTWGKFLHNSCFVLKKMALSLQARQRKGAQLRACPGRTPAPTAARHRSYVRALSASRETYRPVSLQQAGAGRGQLLAKSLFGSSDVVGEYTETLTEKVGQKPRWNNSVAGTMSVACSGPVLGATVLFCCVLVLAADPQPGKGGQGLCARKGRRDHVPGGAEKGQSLHQQARRADSGSTGAMGCPAETRKVLACCCRVCVLQVHRPVAVGGRRRSAGVCCHPERLEPQMVSL